jgi:hypothetical protein
MPVGQLVRAIGRWQIRRSGDAHEEGVFKEICQMESPVEAGHSMIGNGSRVSFQKVLDSCESTFLFLVVFVFRCK